MKIGLLLDVRTAASHGLISRVQSTGFNSKFEQSPWVIKLGTSRFVLYLGNLKKN